MKFDLRTVIWSTLAVSSSSLGVAIYKAAGNSNDTAIAAVLATLALGRTVTLLRTNVNRSRLINKREIARLFGVSVETVDLWLASGKLPKAKKRLWRRKWEHDKIAALRKSVSSLDPSCGKPPEPHERDI